MILSVTLNPSVDYTFRVGILKFHDTNRVQESQRDAGGKGVNLSRVVCELGHKSVALGFLGGGPGAFVRCVLKAQGVREDFIEVSGETRINFSVEDESENPPTTFNQQGPEIRTEDWVALINHLERWALGAEWLCLGGSLPGGVSSNAYEVLSQIGMDRGVRVCVDADGEPLEHAMNLGLSLIKPNSKEASRLLGREVTPKNAGDAVRELYERLAPRNADAIAIISLGESGSVLCSRYGAIRAVPPDIQARSTVGSGDSMIAGFVVGRGTGPPTYKAIEQALRLGTACGAATALTDGSEIARRPVIDRLLSQVRIEPI